MIHRQASKWRRYSRGAAVAAFITVITALAAAPPVIAAGAHRTVPTVSDPTAYVDPMIGTGNGGQVVGDINDFPGVDAPFGMMQLSPDTQGNSEGYSYSSSTITGFSLNHASTGCSSFGDIPILPVTGAVSNPGSASATFSHDTEHATLGSYQALLTNSNINVGLTATTRTGLLSFDYPAGSTAQVLVKSGTSHSGIRTAAVNVIGDHEVTGSATTNGLCGMGSYTIYFDMVFDRPFAASGTWVGKTVTADSTSATGSGTGAYLTFDTTGSTKVVAKVGMSYVSVAGAKANMAAEVHGFDPAAVAASTRSAWRSALSKIEVGGGTDGDLTTFYTALYHSLQFPTVFNDTDGHYIGFDNVVHQVPHGQTQYATFSDWDIYRALAPLQAMLYPNQAGDMANSLLRDAQQQGDWWPRWPAVNVSTTGTMNGDSGVPLFANYYLFGGKSADIRDALPIMEKGANQSAVQGWGWQERQCVEEYVALGYAPNDACSQGSHGKQGVSETAEWSIDDFAISRLASAVGASKTARQYQLRSQSWQNVLNPVTGYLQPRDASGAFPNGPAFVAPPSNAFGQDGYDEGNAADYNWLVPQNMAGLIAAMGGSNVAIPRLDTYFSQNNAGPNLPYQWAGNEVDLSVPWVYDYLGQPWKTQAQVRSTEQQLYPPTTGGLPGNDDLGAMSSWFVWAALGLYPVTPGTTDLAMASPLFQRAVVHLGNGKKIEVNAPAAADDAPYVTGVKLNGKAYGSTGLPQSFATGGGTLDVSLSTRPDTKWGTAAKDAPPSYQTGQDSAIGLLNPSAQSGQEVVTAGDSLPVSVGGQGTGLQPTELRWTASAPAGVTVTPSSGKVHVPAKGQATAPVTVTVSSSAASGFYPVTFTYAGPGNKPLGPANVLNLTVQESDQTAIVADDLGSPDTPNGLTEVDQGDGHTTATTAGGLPGRTTTGSGSFYMYFNIDNSLVPGGNYQATAYVSYYDHGTASWNIQYDSATPNAAFQNSAQVTNTNTDTWKTAAIPLGGAGFSNRENGGNDFRLNIGSGSQTIGRVALTITGSNVLAMHLAPAQPTPPTVTRQPADATVAAGGSVTFTAAATADPVPVVQWQSLPPGGTDWVDVSGATSATLTVAGVTAGADGTQYRAVFTNLAGTNTSNAATLHVK
jgi:predicted alpha-1,2-mannosidase